MNVGLLLEVGVAGVGAALFLDLLLMPWVRRKLGWAPVNSRSPLSVLKWAAWFDVAGVALFGFWWDGDLQSKAFWGTLLAIDLWRIWHHDDTTRRRREAIAAAKVRLRDFAPSPIPMPGAA